MISRILALSFVLVCAMGVAADEIDYGPIPAPQQPEVEPLHLIPPQNYDNNVRLASAPAEDSVSEKRGILQRKIQEADALQGEIEKLRSEIGANQQIVVRVAMLEVSLTKLQKQGVDFSTPDSGKLNVTDFESLRKMIETCGSNLCSCSCQQCACTSECEGTKSIVDMLEKNNIAKVVARPTVVLVNGRAASLFVGEELPIQPAPNSTAAIEFQKCGTELDVVAKAQNNNRVQLDIRAKLSERDASQSIVVDGGKVPAMCVRQCSTGVEATFGKPIVLNGLVEEVHEAIETEEGVKDETNHVALMIIVTPELVDPIATAPKPEASRIRSY
jgi:Flp pilus assembly secretin CpaC